MDITPEMLYRVTIGVNVFFLVLVYVFSFDLFEFSPVILEKGLLLLNNKTAPKRYVGYPGLESPSVFNLVPRVFPVKP